MKRRGLRLEITESVKEESVRPDISIIHHGAWTINQEKRNLVKKKKWRIDRETSRDVNTCRIVGDVEKQTED